MQQYIKFLNEYEALDHMEVISASDPEPETPCYLPQHPVFKEDSATTKLRVVFDTSGNTSIGLSLNCTLLPGPTIQQDLLPIIIRFREQLCYHR
jgi:hypothetical protein